jgi:hypothetical protein
VTVGVTAQNGFSSQVNLTISGMPAGVTANPSEFTLSPGSQQSVVIAASLTATAASSTLAVTGTAGSLRHSGQIGLQISTSQGPLPAAARIRYIQTDTQWDATFFNFFPQVLILYHSKTHRFFVSDTYLNQVVVIDARTETIIARIPVPGAFGGDISPDQSTIYMGTQVGDLYEIDPVAMAVKARIPALQIGPTGFATYEVQVMGDGRLALLGGEGGIPAVDGFSYLAIWNPVSNALLLPGSAGAPSGCASQDHIIGFRLTADRSKVLLGSGVSTGALCAYDPTTGNQAVVETNPSGIGTGQILVPDGKKILVAAGSSVTVYDASTLQQIDQFSVGTATGFYRFLLSLDGNTMFVIPEGGGQYGLAYNWRTHTQTGWIPSFGLYDQPGAMGPLPMAVDETGLLACAIGHGVALLDGSALESQLPATPLFGFAYNNVAQPSFGPVEGGTQVVLTGFQVNNIQNVSFGSNAAKVASSGSLGITVTTPPGVPGPSDVSVSLSDGAYWLFPRNYSYGPSMVQVRPETAVSDGGSGTIYGYGFGPPTPGGQATGLQLTVGGQPATITSYLPQPYSQATPYYPFPLESVTYTIPPGIAGSTANLTLSNSAGTAVLANAIRYLAPTQQYPLAGAVLVQGIYDPGRDVYYFTDEKQIQVFSLTQAKWLPPIAMPAGAQRLWGIALSPNGTRLAVSDAGSARIYTLNPATPAAVSSFSLPTTSADVGEEPCGLAITDSGIVYYASFAAEFTGTWAIHKLNTGTGAVTDYHELQDGALTEDALMRLILTKDNARVFGNMAGVTFSIDTATDTFNFNPTLQFGFDYELALSSNQTWMSSADYLMDTNLNPESFLVYIDHDVWNQFFVYGEKLSADGNLLFSPLSNAIDVIDGRMGTMRTRVALPFALSPNYDALVSDGRDNVLVAITGQNGDGIAVIDLTSLPENSAPAGAAVRSPLLRMAEWTAQTRSMKPRTPRSNLVARGAARKRHVSVSPALRSRTR